MGSVVFVQVVQVVQVVNVFGNDDVVSLLQVEISDFIVVGSCVDLVQVLMQDQVVFVVELVVQVLVIFVMLQIIVFLVIQLVIVLVVQLQFVVVIVVNFFVELKIYDIISQLISQLFVQVQQDGVILVVGLLLKENVEEVIKSNMLFNVLVFNQLEKVESCVNFCYFVFFLEDEVCDVV